MMAADMNDMSEEVLDAILRGTAPMDLAPIAMENIRLREIAQKVFQNKYKDAETIIYVDTVLKPSAIQFLEMFGPFLSNIHVNLELTDRSQPNLIGIARQTFEILNSVCSKTLQEFAFGDVDVEYTEVEVPSIFQFFQRKIHKITLYRCHCVHQILSSVSDCLSVDFVATELVKWDLINTIPGLEELQFGFPYYIANEEELDHQCRGIENFIKRHCDLKKLTARYIYGPRISFDFSIISSIHQLEELTLDVQRYTPNLVGIYSMANLMHLKKLTLSGEDDYIANLLERSASVLSLESLTINGNLFDRKQFESIGRFLNLRELKLICLQETGFGDEQLKYLTAFGELTTLSICTRSQFSEDAFVDLFNFLRNIRKIILDTPLMLTENTYRRILPICASDMSVTVVYRNSTDQATEYLEQHSLNNAEFLRFEEVNNSDEELIMIN